MQGENERVLVICCSAAMKGNERVLTARYLLQCYNEGHERV